MFQISHFWGHIWLWMLWTLLWRLWHSPLGIGSEIIFKYFLNIKPKLICLSYHIVHVSSFQTTASCIFLTREVNDSFMTGHSALFHKELVEIITAGGQYSFMCPMLFTLNDQGDVTKLISQSLLVQPVQHRLPMLW